VGKAAVLKWVPNVVGLSTATSEGEATDGKEEAMMGLTKNNSVLGVRLKKRETRRPGGNLLNMLYMCLRGIHTHTLNTTTESPFRKPHTKKVSLGIYKTETVRQALASALEHL